MNISSRCEYACRAILELAQLDQGEEPVTATQIAANQNIPEKYLVHIMLQLKRAGLVRSIRGAQGGYLLARHVDTITLRDIVWAIDGPVLDPLPAGDNGASALAPAWHEIARDIEKILGEVTVRDLLERASKSEMYYI